MYIGAALNKYLHVVHTADPRLVASVRAKVLTILSVSSGVANCALSNSKIMNIFVYSIMGIVERHNK
jgi:hypothetical protein